MRRVRKPPPLEPRPIDAHKASVGRVLVVGGSRDLCGAPALAALGALRAGAGLVRIAVPAPIQGVVAGMRPEATTAGLPSTQGGTLSASAPATILRMVESWDAVVLGPGGGREPGVVRTFLKVAREIERPLVVDADGLFALASMPEHLVGREQPTVLTPHEGEAARLLGTTSERVRADRQKAALSLAERSGAVVVLKGPGTIVTDAERLFVCHSGGPWLATGGTGDVLAGVVGAFLAGLPGTGRDAFGAAAAAVDVHAAAADACARGQDRGLLASDVARALPDAIAAKVRGSRPPPSAER